MQEDLTFDDVLILPRFSDIKSRKDVSVRSSLLDLDFPIISSNMDTVTGPVMATAMKQAGGVGCLHRFCTIEENVGMLKESPKGTWVSVGLGNNELERAEALWQAGASTIVIDVAHGASMGVVNQFKELKKLLICPDIIVGNFATHDSIKEFMYHVGNEISPIAFKVGIGPGSSCTTRVVTGCGRSQFSTILDCAKSHYPIIADGGIRNSGDFAKAIAAGASGVMLGRVLAGCDESLALPTHKTTYEDEIKETKIICKSYRGSASLESYQAQGKISDHRTPEGDSYLIPYTGSVKDTLQQFEAGLRSAMSYVGASNLEEFNFNSKFIKITSNGLKENGAHGK